MLIKSVKLRNIRSYTDETITFPEGSTLLAGDIGSGKSSILLAIEFALFGIARGVLSGSSLLRLGEDEGYVELSLEVDGKELLIRRTLKRSKEDVRQESGYIIVDGQKTEGTAVELKQSVLDILGYPKTLLTKSKSLIYRYTVYTPQEEMKAILTEEAELRLDTLRKLFQIDRYQRIRENAQVLHKELRQRQALLKGQILDIDEKERLLSRALDDIKLKDTALSSLIPRIEKLTSDVLAKRREIKAKEGEIREYNQLKSEYAAVKASLTEKQNSLGKGLADSQFTIKQIALLELRISEMRTLEPAQGKSSDEELELLSQKRDAIQRQITQLECDIGAQQKLKNDYKKVEEDITSLKRCPLCLQDIAPAHIAHIRKDQDEKIAGSDRIIFDNKSRLEQLSKERKAVDERLFDLKQEARQENEFRLKLKEKENLQNLLREKQTAKLQLEDKQEALKSEIESLTEKRIVLEARIEERKELDKEQETLKTELESLEKAERIILIESTKLRSELDSLIANRAVLEDEVSRKRRARDELRLLVQKQNWLQLVFTELMLQIERAVMMRVYNEFNEIFQQFFSMLLEDANLSVNLTEDFSPSVEQAGYDILYEDLSGGEKTSIALAYRLALNRVVNDLIDNIKTDDLIILDEPTDGFSTDQLDKMRTVLEALGTKQTIIVSHEQKIESFVQNIIRVGKREHTSSII